MTLQSPAPKKLSLSTPKIPCTMSGSAERAPSARLDEAIGLARAIDLDIVDSGLVAVERILSLSE